MFVPQNQRDSSYLQGKLSQLLYKSQGDSNNLLCKRHHKKMLCGRLSLNRIGPPHIAPNSHS